MGKPHLITIKSRHKDRILTGSNCIVFMDRKRLKFLKSIKFEVKARDIAKVTLELFANFKISETIGDLECKKIELK